MNFLNIDVLLVEDNPYDAELTLYALQARNFANSIYHVRDGQEALDFIFAEGKYTERKTAKPPKLVLLDLKMPKINGVEVLEELKKHEASKTIPVVVLTSSNEDIDIDRCYKLGVNSYIVKPVEFDAFSKVVAELGFYWMMLNKTS
ncbi:MAG: response regulator [Chitinophagales bacterium]|mgnify:CR=1 FL=1|nr:response regulator [Chitinophagales bacterium]